MEPIRSLLGRIGPLVLLAVILLSCSSRYRMDLFHIADGERSKIDVEGAVFTSDSRLSQPFETPEVVPGDRSAVVIVLGMRGERMGSGGLYEPLSFDRYLQYRLYLELPNTPLPNKPDTIPLEGNSYVRLMGFYERTPAEKTYLPAAAASEESDGLFIIDSVKSNNLYGTFLNAYWSNTTGELVGFAGRLKLKVR